MSNIIKFDSADHLPAYLSNADVAKDINSEVVTSAAFPTMSIRGKQFTVSRDGVKTILMKPGTDEEEVAQSIGVVFLRANMNAKVFYAKKFVEGDSDFQRPDCYSYDGVAPGANATSPQATKCAICPHNQWGSRVRDDGEDGEEKKGKACADNARIALSAPDKLDPMLLRVPPASLKGLKEMFKVVKARKIPYNAVVVRLGFDREASSPKLTFKPVGLLSDSMYQEVNELYDGELVRGIVGLDDLGHPEAPELPAPSVGTDELDAALAARDATAKAAAKPAAKAAPKAAPKAPVEDDELDDILAPQPAPKSQAKPKAAAKPEPQPEDDAPKAAPKSGGSSLLDDLDDLLGNKDD